MSTGAGIGEDCGVGRGCILVAELDFTSNNIGKGTENYGGDDGI